MANEMIERVARAIAALNAGPWQTWEQEARAAIEAMRQCDGGMILAGAEELEPYATQEIPWKNACERVLDVWPAMIDAALTP